MYDWGGVRLLTVGRCTYEKGIDIAIEAAIVLKEKEYDYVWYFVGAYDELPNIVVERLRQARLEENIVFCGVQENPYPYFKECDIYVHTSRIEGYGLTINEARILGKAIITTDTAAADEQVRHGLNGLIVNKDGKSVAQGIEQIIINPELMKQFEQENMKIDFRDIDRQILFEIENLFFEE